VHLTDIDFIASYGRMMGKWWIGKDVERSGSDLILRNYPDHFPGGIEETTKNLKHVCRSPG
jgi:hypothetical protein